MKQVCKTKVDSKLPLQTNVNMLESELIIQTFTNLWIDMWKYNKAQSKETTKPIHPLCVTTFMEGGGFAGANPSCLWGRAVASSSQGPHWWQRPRCKVPAAQQVQFGFQYLAQDTWTCSSTPAAFRSLANLLYPLSYSRPHLAPAFQFACFLLGVGCFSWAHFITEGYQNFAVVSMTYGPFVCKKHKTLTASLLISSWLTC